MSEQTASPVTDDDPARHRSRSRLVWTLATFVVALLVAYVGAVIRWSHATPLTWPVSAMGALVFASVAYLWQLQPGEWLNKLYPNFGLISLAAGAVTLPFWWEYRRVYFASAAQGGTQDEFFATIAAVLPILLLATTVDLRQSRAVETYQIAFFVMSVAFGEFACLFSLSYDFRQPYQFGIASSSMVAAFVGLAICLFAKGKAAQPTEPDAAGAELDELRRIAQLLSARLPPDPEGSATAGQQTNDAQSRSTRSETETA